MAKTLEQRVDIIEREIASMKSRSKLTDDRVQAIDADISNIPDLIRVESRVMQSRFSRLEGEFDTLKSHIDARFDAAIRAISEIVAEKKPRN